MGFKFNPFIGNFDIDSKLSLDNPLQFKGTISVASDFPTLAEIKNGWFYIISIDVVDNDSSKTNTGQSFKAGDEVVWNGINWTVFGPASLLLDQTISQTIKNGIPVFEEGVAVGDSSTIVSKDVSGNIIFTDAITGTKTLAQLSEGGGGITEHQLLSNINWANSGHTIDSDLDVGNNKITSLAAPENDSDAATKKYVDDNSGGGASSLPELSDVDSDLDYTEKNILQSDGSKYFGGSYSHDNLDDIGSISHTSIDSHISSDTSVHTSATNLVQTTGNQTIGGIKTFTSFPITPSSQPTTDYQVVNKLYVDNYVQGLSWIKPVLSKNLSNPSSLTPVIGDRYIVNAVGTDEWEGKDNDIAEYNGVSWSFTEAVEGTAVIVLDTNKGFTFNGDEWIQFSEQLVYTAGDGLELDGLEFSTKLDGTTLEQSEDGIKLSAGFGLANQILGMNASATEHEYKNIVAGSNVTINQTEGEIEISSSLSGAPDYTYSDITLHSHPASSFVFTNLPLALTAASSYLRKKVDLTGAVQYRIVVNQITAGYAGSKLRLRYSTNNSVFNDIDSDNSGDLDVGTGIGVKTGTWVDIISGAKQDVWLQLFGHSGDGIADPAFRQVTIQIKYNSSIVDGSMSDKVIKEITIHAHPTSNSVWTNMPLELTEFMNTSLSTRRKADLTNCTHYRICVNQAVAGFAGSDFNVQYSTNGTTFQALDIASAGELDVGTGTGIKYGAWASIVDSAKGDVWLRIVGKDGNGVADPSWRWIAIQLKEYTFGQGVTGNDKEVLFNNEGSTGTDNRFIFDKITGQLLVPNLNGNAAQFDDDNNHTITLTDGNQAAIFSDSTNQVNVCDGFYALLIDGDISMSGDINMTGYIAATNLSGTNTGDQIITESTGITIDGAGSNIVTGIKGYIRIPYSGTIKSVSLTAGEVGSIVIDVWKDTTIPTVADTITASAKPTLSSEQTSVDSTLTGWTTTITKGDYLGYNVDSCTGIKKVTLVLEIENV